MTLPNGADGLSDNIDLAFPLSAGSPIPGQSLANRDTFDQPTVEAMLKDDIRSSQGWQSAHQAGYAGLPSGVPQIIGILAKVAEQITGIPVSTWVAQWTANPIVANLNAVVTDSLAAIYQTSVNIQQFLGSLDFTDPDFNLLTAAQQFFDIILAPINKIATLVGGFILSTLIPGLDASKIVTGTFPQSMLNITSIAAGIVTGLLDAAQIPGLDTSKIVTGIFGTGVIPNLDAAKIVSGFFSALRIPGLDTSKIISGVFPQSMLSITSIAAGIVTGLLNAAQIPGLDTSKIVTGIFGTSVIPNLDAAKIVSGLFDALRIPGLDTSKIVTGLFPQSQTTNLVSDLLSKLGVNVFTAASKGGPNIVLDPAFEDTTIVRNFAGAAGSGYSTEQSHSGTHSFKIVSAGGFEELDLIPTPGGTFAQDVSKSIVVQPGDKWILEGWIFAKSTNTTNSTGNGFIIRYDDSKGVNAANYAWANDITTNYFADPPVGVWTKRSGHVTIPAGYDRMLPFWSTSNPTPVGNTYYIDDVNVAQDITPAKSSGIQDIINSVTNFLQGLTGSSWGQAQANTALSATKMSIDQVAAQIQALSATQGGANNSGVSVVVNYNDYANGSLPATHTVVTDGTNTSTIGITSGRVHFNEVNNGDYKDFEVLYNAKQTNTDYQLVGITLTTMMESGFGVTATNWIKARMNTAQTRYIYVAFHKDDFNNLYFRLVAVTASGGITWKDWTAMPWASTAWLETGTAGGLRVYRVWAGNQIVWTHTEVGTLSDVGASNRSCGFGGEVLPSVGGAMSPGDLSSFAFYDNQPPATVGITASHYRNSTAGTGTGGTGDREIPASTFDTALRSTPGITLVNGKSYQVAEAGTYRFQFCLHNVAGMVTSNVEPLLYVTPSGGVSAIRKRGGHQYFDGSTHTRLHGDFSVYLNAGDAVTPGIGSPSFTWSIAGESTGSFTWMAMALENKNTN